MIRIGGNALPRSIVMFLAVIVVMVSFALTAAEPLRAARTAAEWQTGLSGGTCYSFPEQTVDPVLIAKSDDTSVLQQLIESQQLFTACGGVNGSGDAVFPSRFRIFSKNDSVDIKNTILLKLRI